MKWLSEDSLSLLEPVGNFDVAFPHVDDTTAGRSCQYQSHHHGIGQSKAWFTKDPPAEADPTDGPFDAATQLCRGSTFTTLSRIWFKAGLQDGRRGQKGQINQHRQIGVIDAVGFFDPLGIARNGFWSSLRKAGKKSWCKALLCTCLRFACTLPRFAPLCVHWQAVPRLGFSEDRGQVGFAFGLDSECRGGAIR